jgi:hypothetical protein
MPACSVDLYPQQVCHCIWIWRKEVRRIAGEESQTLTHQSLNLIAVWDSVVDYEMSHLIDISGPGLSNPPACLLLFTKLVLTSF